MNINYIRWLSKHGKIREDKKISFDKNYAEELWRSYNEIKQVDDSAVVEELKTVVKNKTVLLVAPGKSIIKYKKDIEDQIALDNVISIGLNLTEPFAVDFMMITRQDMYEAALNSGTSIITTSNVSKGTRGNVKVLNYKNWIDISEGRTHDSSSVILLNLLKACGVKSIILAGFDGFMVNINEKYSDPNLRHPVSAEQVERRNAYYKHFVQDLSGLGINVHFLTPSKYM